MLLDIKALKKLPEFAGFDDTELTEKVRAVESVIRSSTNNNFQSRMMRFIAPVADGKVQGGSPYFKVNDTVQISESINDGVFIITALEAGTMALDGDLYDSTHNLLTKVIYPADVKQGAVNILKWEVRNRAKVGVKSETLSRHSVTYFDLDANNERMGYPASLTGFLKPYRKARF